MKNSAVARQTVFWDKLGITVSLLCAVHCMTLPILLPVIAASGVAILSEPGFELGMIALAVLIGVYSMIKSFWDHHRKVYPFYFIGVGLLLLVLAKGGAVGEEFEEIMVPLGALCIALAHGLNWRLCKSCPVCRETDDANAV